MATILSQCRVCDGYDVRVELSPDLIRAFHFPSKPADVAGATAIVIASLGPDPPFRPVPVEWDRVLAAAEKWLETRSAARTALLNFLADARKMEAA